MSKRFTETTLWDEDWFIDLPGDYQKFYIFLKDKCDHAGIWKPNLTTFNKLYGCSVNLEEAIKLLNADKKRIDVLKNGRWFLNGFISFQYGDHLNPNNRVHKSILKILEENEVNFTSIRPQLEDTQGLKDKDKEKDKENIQQQAIAEVFQYFCFTLNKKIVLSEERKKIIEKRLSEGRTVEEMKRAIDNFSKDDWPERKKFCDIIYALGVRNKVDNLDKWLAGKEGFKLVPAKHPKNCPECWGAGIIHPPGGKSIVCWIKH